MAREQEAKKAAAYIAASIKSGKEQITFLVGSYVSQNEAGVPGVNPIVAQIWEDIASTLHSYHCDAPIFEKSTVRKDIRVQFEVYFQLMDDGLRARMVDWIKGAMSVGVPGETHRFLAFLAAAHSNVAIVTTNFDTLFEQCLPGVSPLISEDDFRSSRTSPYLAKVHGCVSDRETMVVNMRQIAGGLPHPTAAWLERRLDTSSFVYLGYGANDFDIYPLIITSKNSSAQDVFAIRPRFSSDTDEAYAQEHVKQNELAARRQGNLVVDYAGFMNCLMAEFGSAGVVKKMPMLPPPGSPLANERPDQLLTYVLRLLEYAGYTYEGQDIIHAARKFPADIDWTVAAETYHQCARFDDLAKLAKKKMRHAILRRRWIEFADALNYFATARCNQRFLWFLIFSFASDALMSKARPVKEDVASWDAIIRARQHWAIGIGLISDVLTRARLPSHRWFRRLAARKFQSLETALEMGRNKHRISACSMERARFSTYDQRTNLGQDLAALRDEFLTLNQLGRGGDLTVALDRAVDICGSNTVEDSLKEEFGRWFIENSFEAALRRGWTMVALKCFRRFPPNSTLLHKDAFTNRLLAWGFQHDQFGLWGLNMRLATKRRSPKRTLQEHADEGRELADWVHSHRDELYQELI